MIDEKRERKYQKLNLIRLRSHFSLLDEIVLKATRVNCRVQRKFGRSSGEMPEGE